LGWRTGAARQGSHANHHRAYAPFFHFRCKERKCNSMPPITLSCSLHDNVLIDGKTHIIQLTCSAVHQLIVAPGLSRYSRSTCGQFLRGLQPPRRVRRRVSVRLPRPAPTWIHAGSPDERQVERLSFSLCLPPLLSIIHSWDRTNRSATGSAAGQYHS